MTLYHTRKSSRNSPAPAGVAHYSYNRVSIMVKSKKDKYIASSKKRTGKPKRVLCQWTNEQMENAMRAVVNGEMGMNRAALQYGVPPTTLKDRMSGRVMHGSKIGPKRKIGS